MRCQYRTQRALHRPSATVKHVRVDLRRSNVLVTKLLLDCTHIHAQLEKVRRERMPQGVAARGFIDSGQTYRAFHRLLNCALVQVMPAPGPQAGIVHNFAYRYDYLWVRRENGDVEKWSEKAGRSSWDDVFLRIGDYVNGVFIINSLARIALALGGWLAWRQNRKRNSPELKPESKTIINDEK